MCPCQKSKSVTCDFGVKSATTHLWSWPVERPKPKDPFVCWRRVRSYSTWIESWTGGPVGPLLHTSYLMDQQTEFVQKLGSTNMAKRHTTALYKSFIENEIFRRQTTFPLIKWVYNVFIIEYLTWYNLKSPKIEPQTVAIPPTSRFNTIT